MRDTFPLLATGQELLIAQTKKKRLRDCGGGGGVTMCINVATPSWVRVRHWSAPERAANSGGGGPSKTGDDPLGGLQGPMKEQAASRSSPWEVPLSLEEEFDALASLHHNQGLVRDKDSPPRQRDKPDSAPDNRLLAARILDGHPLILQQKLYQLRLLALQQRKTCREVVPSMRWPSSASEPSSPLLPPPSGFQFPSSVPVPKEEEELSAETSDRTSEESASSIKSENSSSTVAQFVWDCRESSSSYPSAPLSSSAASSREGAGLDKETAVDHGGGGEVLEKKQQVCDVEQTCGLRETKVLPATHVINSCSTLPSASGSSSYCHETYPHLSHQEEEAAEQSSEDGVLRKRWKRRRRQQQQPLCQQQQQNQPLRRRPNVESGISHRSSSIWPVWKGWRSSSFCDLPKFISAIMLLCSVFAVPAQAKSK